MGPGKLKGRLILPLAASRRSAGGQSRKRQKEEGNLSPHGYSGCEAHVPHFHVILAAGADDVESRLVNPVLVLGGEAVVLLRIGQLALEQFVLEFLREEGHEVRGRLPQS